MDTVTHLSTVAQFMDNITTEPLHLYSRYTSEQDIYLVHRPILYYTERYIPPLWFLVGFPGNILAFLIWIQPRMRPSSGVYLTALALGDFIFLILQLIFYLQNTYSIMLIYYPVLCQLFPILFLASQYLNPLLVLGFTVERYIAICHPFQRDKFCSTQRAIKVVAFLVLFSILLHVIQGYFWIYSEGECMPRNGLADPASIWSIWSWITEILVFGLVPLAILVLNIRVILETRRIKQSEKKRLGLIKGQKIQKRKSGASATTFMLLAVSFYMLFTTLPVTLLYVLRPLFPQPNLEMTDEQIQNDPEWQRYFTFVTLRTIIERLCISHYACNFYIYLLTGRVFRKELQTICINTFCKNMKYRIRNAELDDLLSTYKKPESHNGQNGSIAHV